MTRILISTGRTLALDELTQDVQDILAMAAKVKIDGSDNTADYLDAKIAVENIDKTILNLAGYHQTFLRARNGLAWTRPEPTTLTNAYNENIDLEFGQLCAGFIPRTNLYVQLSGTGLSR